MALLNSLYEGTSKLSGEVKGKVAESEWPFFSPIMLRFGVHPLLFCCPSRWCLNFTFHTQVLPESQLQCPLAPFRLVSLCPLSFCSPQCSKHRPLLLFHTQFPET